MHEVNWRVGSKKPFEFMEASVFLRHRRSNSDPIQFQVQKHRLEDFVEACKLKMGKLEESVESKKNQPLNTEVQNSLKEEILELQDRLQKQFVTRRALEKALSYKPFSRNIMTDKSIPKSARELITEIAVLELEVVYLERHLLSLYRRTFNQQESLSKLKTDIHEGIFVADPKHNIMSSKDNCNDILGPERLLDNGIHRCHSSISQHSTATSTMKSIARAVDSYHSLPLSMLEQAQNGASNRTSLADHLGTNIYGLETPNALSEEMIKCISAIYCELADPPLINAEYPPSPISFSSSLNELTLQAKDESWSPQFGNFSSFNSSVDNRFHVTESKEFSGPYCLMAKVKSVSRDKQKLNDIQHKLQHFRSLVARLEAVDIRKMKHEEKLAFWINVHNSLVMHAFLVCGIPQNKKKRLSLVLKAAYNIGGHTINVDMIQNSIMDCRLPRPGQWLQVLFSSKTKFKIGDAQKAYYSIDHPEPRLYFALSSGSYSDAAVRVYTPKRVFEDLEAAKEEYIQSNFVIQKQKKLLLPKIVQSFGKALDLCPAGLVEMIEPLLPISLTKNIQQCQYRKFAKSIEWIPHNFTFQFLLSKELVPQGLHV